MADELGERYKKLAKNANPDLMKAATLSRLAESGGKSLKSTRVPNDENGPLFPRGATIYFRSVDASQLKPGSFVFMRRGTEMNVRRFIRFEVTRKALLIHLSRVDGSLEEPIQPSQLLGLITKVEAGDRSYDPGRSRSFMDFLTDFGTISPLTKLLRLFRSLLPARYHATAPVALSVVDAEAS